MAINREFTFQDITIQMLGKSVVGARKVKYVPKQSVTNLYGTGKKPIGRSYGKIEYEGELVIYQSELHALQSTLARGKSILDIADFDISVSYLDTDGTTSTDLIKDCRFLEVPKELGVDDEFMEVTIPIAIGDIQYNV